MKFTDEIVALFGQYKQNIKIIRNDSTLEIFGYILRNPNKQVAQTLVSKIQIGKFYIIQYNYNGNKIWCPILTIPPVPNKNEKGILERQLKIFENKQILYAINFDYLSIKYKAILIENILKNNFQRYESNSDKISQGDSVNQEINFKVNWIYQFLKNNGEKQFAVTGFNVDKILKVFEISSTILHRFVFVDTYYINRRMMLETLENIQNEKLKEEFFQKIKTFDDILKLYESDVETFYKSLRSFEKNLKLVDEL